MCGIAGVIRADGEGPDGDTARAMLAALAHRGPDGEGEWREGGVWFGHRRLAVVDLSPAGRQPMVSAGGRFLITFNGEIYNHRDLRRSVEAVATPPWRGHSDVEVFLECIAHFGLEATFEMARGMFAFALWDREERRLHMARDRFGEKPLYYKADARGLSFASELTALERAPRLDPSLSPEALSLFFRLGYIPAPLTIYRDVYKLPPGCHLSWRAGEAARVEPYWRLADTVEAGRADRLTDADEAVGALDAVLREAIAPQMLADVPLGAFLSGGIDSSLVVAIMQSISDRPVRTFTLGFDVPAFDEAPFAAEVAACLGTLHTEHTVTAADAQAIVPRLGTLFDEPFADASQIPTFLISRMAREQVTVALTGDGGDEGFGGYVRYPGVPRLWNGLKRLPFRRPAVRLLAALPMGFTQRALGFLGPLADGYAARGRLGAGLRRAAGWATARDQAELYELTMTAWSDPDALLVAPPAAVAPWRPPAPAFDNDLEAMMWRDAVDYLPGDVLCKVDRASMASGLETRAPLLDHRVAAFAWRAPPSMKMRAGQTKWLLRQVLYRYVPRDLVDRPKVGFSVPLHDWLSGALRDWAGDLLASDRIVRQGVLRPRPVERVWRRYLGGDTSADHQVWCLLMFQAWMEARGR